MRVIAGKYRGRTLRSLRGVDVRPTSDRLRETLFNVLTAGNPTALEGSVWLDLFAGTGAVGIEALSRGASRAVFIEHSQAAVKVIRDNLWSLGLYARAQVRQGRASVVLAQINKTVEIDGAIVFLDPPYSLAQEYERSLSILGERSPDPEMPEVSPLVIAQHASREELAESYGNLRRVRVVKHGDNALSFFERPE